MPHIPLRIRIAAWIAFFAILGAWWWLVTTAVYDWFPDWLNDILFTAMVCGFAYYFGYERGLSRGQDLRDASLTDSPEQSGGVVPDFLPLGADRD